MLEVRTMDDLRFRLALTEGQEPGVRTYQQDRWAELHDARTAPPAISVALVAAMHERWVLLLRSLAPFDFSRTVRLGVRLFVRGTRQMEPTPAGARLLQTAQTVLEELSAAERAAREATTAASSVLRITTECYMCRTRTRAQTTLLDDQSSY